MGCGIGDQYDPNWMESLGIDISTLGHIDESHFIRDDGRFNDLFGPRSLHAFGLAMDINANPPAEKTPEQRFEDDVNDILDEVETMLIEKNRKYGDSALNPSRIFSKSDAVEQIKVRIDDKLTRLRNQQDDEDEDVVKDLLGYLVILRIAQKRRET